ncbi:MAG: hypothetical protein AAF467_05810 [Actinomycetota bacterium]
MTNEFDDLVSAYVDGQATPTEIARVEADPELLALAARWQAQATALRAVPPADPGLRRAQIGAALDAFDGATVAPVVPLDPRRALQADAARAATDTAAARVEPARQIPRRDRGGRLQWLGAAAAAVVVVGGLGWALNQSGVDDDDTAASVFEEETSEAADAFEAATADEASGDVAEEAAALADDAALEEDLAEEAEAEEALVDDSADSAESADAEASGANEGFFGDGDDAVTEDVDAADADEAAPGRGGFFIDGETVVFDAVPDAETLEAMAQTQRFQPVETSACGGAVAAPEPSLVFRGWIPIDVSSEPGEALVFEGPGDALVVLAVNGVCQQFG